MPLQTETQIKIDANDQWWNGEQSIIHEGILLYFKQNLFRDENGRYFIHNQFGDKHEYGWLESVLGFCLHVESIRVHAKTQSLTLLLNTHTKIERHATEVYVGGESVLWVELKPNEQLSQLGKTVIPVRLKPCAMAALGQYLNLDSAENWVLEFPENTIKLEFKEPIF